MSPIKGRIRSAAEHLQPGRFGRHLSMVLTQTLVESGSLTITVFVVAALFGPADFGVLGLLLVGVQLIGMIAEGVWASQVKAVAERGDPTDRTARLIGWWSALGTTLLFLVASILIALLAVIWDSTYLYEYWLELLLAVAVATTRVLKSSLEAVFRGLRNFSTPAIAASVLAPLQMAALILAAWMGYRIGTYLAIVAVFQGVNGAVLRALYFRNMLSSIPVSERIPPWDRVIGVFLYSRPLMLRGFIGFLYIKLNIPIVAHFSGTEELGYYRLAEQFYFVALLVMGAVVNTMMPRIADLCGRGDKTSLAHLTSRVYGLLFVLFIPLTLFFAFNDVVVRLFFPDYGPATDMIRCFAALIIIRGFSIVSTGGLLPQGGFPGTATLMAAIGSVLNLIAVWLLVPTFGGLGAAMGTVGVHFVMAIVMIVVGHRLLGIPFRVHLPGLSAATPI